MEKLDQFLRELSDLTYKHGLAIGGKPELFELQREDYDTAYHCDASSRLSWGQPGDNGVCEDDN